MGNKGAAKPSSKGKQEVVQSETKGGRRLGKADANGSTIQQRETRRGGNGRQGETQPLGRRAHYYPTQRNKKGYNGRKRETRPLGRRTLQESIQNP